MEGLAVNDPNTTLQLVIAAILAMLGALARRLREKDRTAIQVTRILSGCFGAAFAGVLAHLLAGALSLNTNLAYILAGICGWTGPQIIDGFAAMMTDKIGLKASTGEAAKEDNYL